MGNNINLILYVLLLLFCILCLPHPVYGNLAVVTTVSGHNLT